MPWESRRPPGGDGGCGGTSVVYIRTVGHALAVGSFMLRSMTI